MKQIADSRKYFILLISCLIICLAYGLYFIFELSFVYQGERYFQLFDDAMISMRYAKNFASGKGLVYNNNERVEGFTNFLWTIYMTIPHLMSLSDSKAPLFIQLTCLFLQMFSIYYVLEIGKFFTRSMSVLLITALSLIFYPGITFWGLRGMESNLLILIILITLYLSIVSSKKKVFHPSMFMLLTIAILVRLDMVLFGFAICIFHFFTDYDHRTQYFKAFFYSIVVPVLLMTIFRKFYYGDFLPNTYYLKMTGFPLLPRIVRGSLVFIQFIGILLPFLIFIMIHGLKSRKVSLLSLVIIFQIMYSIYIGGDAWEVTRLSNRFITIVMPLVFFLLYYYSFLFIKNRIIAFLVCIIILGYLFKINPYFLVSEDDTLNGIGHVRIVVQPSTSYGVLGEEPLIRAEKIRDLTRNDAVVAVNAAGTLAYYLDDRYIYDMLGKCVKRTANLIVDIPNSIAYYRRILPGHNKFDIDYTLSVVKPDILADEPWKAIDIEQYNYIRFQGLIIREASPRVHWEKFKN